MLQLLDVAKSYDGVTPALAGIDLHVDAGEIVCLLGPSGCGKTTLLRLVAGLEQPDRGRLLLNGRDLTHTPVHRRKFGLMFQEFALFPHRSVGENIAFGLRMAGMSAAQINSRVDEMLALVNLHGYAGRTVFALSGGERQRVALARSLAPNPQLLMLDEPLGSLDRALREELMTELRAILKRVGVTALYVTHDQQEAYAIGDRLVVMNRGRIEQVGTPQQVYRMPANAFVARFLGFQNLVPATAAPGEPARVTTPVGEFVLPAAPADGVADKGPAMLLIRPEAALSLSALPPGPIAPRATAPTLDGQLAALSFRGSHYRAEIALSIAHEPVRFVFDLPAPLPAPAESTAQPAIGATVRITLDPIQMILLHTG
ncbi:MAG: ABC transporter ATP-binding protein [Caldilineaceae bacterium]|nr:ABC transporter ATP-binding protein [Caldilineaceae bacterium]